MASNDSNTITLRDYIDTRLAAIDHAQVLFADKVDIRFTDLDKAISIANAALDKRLESMNAFRDQLKEQASTFATRTEVDNQFVQARVNRDALDTRLQTQEKASANVAGRFTAVSGVIAFLSIAINIALHFIK